MFRRRTNARNVSFRNSLQWTIYINKIQLNYRAIQPPPNRCSTTVPQKLTPPPPYSVSLCSIDSNNLNTASSRLKVMRLCSVLHVEPLSLTSWRFPKHRQIVWFTVSIQVYQISVSVHYLTSVLKFDIQSLAIINKSRRFFPNNSTKSGFKVL